MQINKLHLKTRIWNKKCWAITLTFMKWVKQLQKLCREKPETHWGTVDTLKIEKGPSEVSELRVSDKYLINIHSKKGRNFFVFWDKILKSSWLIAYLFAWIQMAVFLYIKKTSCFLFHSWHHCERHCTS